MLALLRYAYDVPMNPSPRLSGLPGWTFVRGTEGWTAMRLPPPPNATPAVCPSGVRETSALTLCCEAASQRAVLIGFSTEFVHYLWKTILPYPSSAVNNGFVTNCTPLQQRASLIYKALIINCLVEYPYPCMRLFRPRRRSLDPFSLQLEPHRHLVLGSDRETKGA